MLRTRLAELTAIPAIACRYRREDGRAGLWLQRLDGGPPATAVLDRRTDAVIPDGQPSEAYPPFAFKQAAAATQGQPLISLPQVRAAAVPAFLADFGLNAPGAAEADTAAYAAIVQKTTLPDGRLDLQGLNRACIRLAGRSRRLAEMAAAGGSLAALRAEVLRLRFGRLCGDIRLAQHSAMMFAGLLLDGCPEDSLAPLDRALHRLMRSAADRP